ncbi:MAG: acetylxylan esterase [Clostridia bacterium]|nr:acetylxylan esterase [Clostridia bacterium]
MKMKKILRFILTAVLMVSIILSNLVFVQAADTVNEENNTNTSRLLEMTFANTTTSCGVQSFLSLTPGATYQFDIDCKPESLYLVSQVELYYKQSDKTTYNKSLYVSTDEDNPTRSHISFRFTLEPSQTDKDNGVEVAATDNVQIFLTAERRESGKVWYTNASVKLVENGNVVGNNLVLDPDFTGCPDTLTKTKTETWSILGNNLVAITTDVTDWFKEPLPIPNNPKMWEIGNRKLENWGAIKQEVTLKANKYYKFEIDYLCVNGANALIRIGIKAKGATSYTESDLASVCYNYNLTDTGTKYIVTFRPKALYSGKNFRLILGRNDTCLESNATAYFANISLREDISSTNGAGEEYGENLICNGNFEYGEIGSINNDNIDTQLYCWEQLTQGDTVATYKTNRLIEVPEGLFGSDMSAGKDAPKMLRLGGDGESQEALSVEAKLEGGKTYKFDMDYRAFGGVEPYIHIETSDFGGFAELDSFDTTINNKNGAHYSIRFTMPSNASTTNNFKLTIGQKAPIKRNGTVYFANAKLCEVSNGDIVGENIIVNGDFSKSYGGKVVSDFSDLFFEGWNQLDVMSYKDVSILAIPDNFFEYDRDYKTEYAYKFQGGDMYKPQFDFMFKPSKTYLLSYDYNCENDTTVNAYIQSNDNSVKAQKISRVSDGKYTATYKITTSSYTNIYSEYTSANGNIRFALANNSYDSPFYISNIRIYEVNGDNIVGENLVGDINPIFSESIYSSLENEGDSVDFELAKNDSNANAQTVNLGHGWYGNLNYQGENNNVYSRLVKVSNNFFDFYSDSDKLVVMKKSLLGIKEEYNPYNDSLNLVYDPDENGKIDIKDLIRIKKEILADKYAVSNAETNGGIYDKVNAVKCYGDSITQGMGYESSLEKTYPGWLKSFLGEDYTVLNGGVPSEATYTIMSRQGALSLYTNKEFKFNAGEDTITIGDKNDNGFVTSTGINIDLVYHLGNQISVNDITIDGVKYTILIEDFVWSPRSCTVKLKREDYSSAVTIPAGASVKFNNTATADSLNIYLMGANGHYISTDDLIAQYKAMVDFHGSNNYLIVIPFTNTNYDKKFYEAFGDHCVSFREAAITYGLEFEGITATAADNEKIAEGLVPPSLCLNNTYDVHLNEKGYHLLATLLHEKGRFIEVFNDNANYETVTINSNNISEYKIVNESGNNEATAIINNAIYKTSGVKLAEVDSVPSDEKVIRIVADYRVAVNKAKIYVDGNTLYISAYNTDLIGYSANAFEKLLEDNVLEFNDGYESISAISAVSYETAVADGKTLKLIGDSDANSIEYKAGQTANVTVAAYADGKILSVPYFHVVTFNESNQKTEDYYVSGKNGVCNLSLTSQTEGFVYFNIVACNSSKQKISDFKETDTNYHFVGSVGFNIDEITPSTTKPADFDSFWKTATDEIKNTNIEIVKMKSVSSDKNGFLTYLVELRCGTDVYGNAGVVTGYLTYPANASVTSKIGLMTQFQSYSVAVPDKVYKENTAVFCICAHSIDIEKFISDDNYKTEIKNVLDGFGFENASKENIYFLQMIKRDLLANKFMIEYFGQNGNGFWNNSELIVKGTSMGGFQSIAVAALLKDVTGVNPSLLTVDLPWLCDLNPTAVGRKQSSWRPTYKTALSYYDPVHFATKITCNTVIGAGLGDAICPVSGIVAFYNTLNTQKQITFIQNTSHSGGWEGTRFTVESK